MTRIFDMASNAGEGLAAAAAALEAGELVGLPTETVYGLAADATNPSAVARVYAAKGRPTFNPLIVHVASAAAAAEIAELGETGQHLAGAFWPGPLTIVAPKRTGSGIADLATAGLETVAVRVPAHPVAAALLRAVPFPLVAPSANRSGRITATSAAHVAEDLGEAVAVILDAGPTQIGVESTIVGLGDPPRLLRPGAIDPDAIGAVLGRSLAASDDASPIAPGMLSSHYAPAVPLRLEATEARPGETFLAFGAPPGNAGKVIQLSASRDLTEAAARLFQSLRELDRIGAPAAVAPIPQKGLGLAINDRLRRAAAPRP